MTQASRRAALVVLLVGAGALVPARAVRADTTLEALGSATVVAGDADRARARSLDDAFRQAVEQAIGALVAPAEREARAEVIRKRVLRQARSYVPQYRIVEEGEAEGIYHLRLEATVASAPLVRDLRAAGVAVAAPAGGEPEVDPEVDPAPAASARPRVALLVVTRAGDRTYATFGAGVDGPGPVAEALARELAGLGFEIAPTAGRAAPVSAQAGGRDALPLDEAQAAALAGTAGAGAAVIVGVELRDAGAVRMTDHRGAEATVAFQVVELTGGGPPATLGRARLEAAAFGADPAAAVGEAARAAAERTGRALAPVLLARWPAEAALPPGITVRVRGVRAWAPVAALAKAIAATAGSGTVRVRGVARGEVRLQVEGAEGAAAVAGAIRAAAPAAPGVAAPSVRVASARVVEIELPAPAVAPAVAPTEGER